MRCPRTCRGRAADHPPLDSNITAVAYETVQLPNRTLPLLAPMSEVAGQMAPQVGIHLLEREAGGEVC